MTAREKFKIGGRVEMTEENPARRTKVVNQSGIVNGTSDFYVRVRQDGTKRSSWWHMDFWRVVKEAQHD